MCTLTVSISMIWKTIDACSRTAEPVLIMFEASVAVRIDHLEGQHSFLFHFFFFFFLLFLAPSLDITYH